MLDQYGCKGKVVGGGFYEYLVNGKKWFWLELECEFVDLVKV